jgi:TIR domain
VSSPVESSPVAFISHASADGAHAAEIVRVLEAAGLRCWIAPRDIPAGQEWAAAIVDGVQRSRVLVVVLSARSCASPEVFREVECASRARKPMLTVRIDRNAAPTGSLEYFLSSIQWIDATARPLRPQLGSLPGTVAALLGVPVTPVPPARTRREADIEDIGPDLDTLLRR